MKDQIIFATAGYDSIRFWDASTGMCYRTIQQNDMVKFLFFLEYKN
jgi:hypothetical protein